MKASTRAPLSTSSTGKLAQIAVMSVSIALCAWLSIPAPVPFTMQTFGVFTALKVLGGKDGTISILLYILLGVLGLPVFASFRGGLGVLMGPTGGYVFGFILIGLLDWACSPLCKTRRMKAMPLVAGLLLCYLFGTVWYAAVLGAKGEGITLLQGLATCVFPYVLPDLIKLWLSEVLWRRIHTVAMPK